MKKTLCGLLACLLLLSGCGGGDTDQADAAPMTEEEIAQMYSDPAPFEGRTLELCGRIFDAPEYDEQAVYFQMWADPANADRNTIVAYRDPSVTLEADDYVRITGTVQGTYEGENLLGGTIVAPMIEASALEVISYQEAVAPTLSEAAIDQASQTQLGYTVTLQAVERAEQETRAYVSVTNNGAAAFSLYPYDAKLIQNGRQYEAESNWEADYPEIQTDLMTGATTEGVIVFPAIEEAAFDVVLEGSSDNWEETIQPYTFHCTFPGTDATGDAGETTAQAAGVSYLLCLDGGATRSFGLVLSDTALGDNHLWPTDTKAITADDLSQLTQTEVAAVRNEIYARHGYPFTTEEWTDFFSTASWYQVNSAYSNDLLNATEKANVETILSFEESAGWRQTQADPEQLASQAALDYCSATGWPDSSVNFVQARPDGGYNVNVMKSEPSGLSYEETFVVTVDGGSAVVTGTEQFGVFTPIS